MLAHHCLALCQRRDVGGGDCWSSRLSAWSSPRLRRRNATSVRAAQPRPAMDGACTHVDDSDLHICQRCRRTGLCGKVLGWVLVHLTRKKRRPPCEAWGRYAKHPSLERTTGGRLAQGVCPVDRVAAKLAGRGMTVKRAWLLCHADQHIDMFRGVALVRKVVGRWRW